MDDLKIFAKSECEVNGLISAVQILDNDIGMEFGTKRCGVLVLKSRKVVSSEGVEMNDGERIKEIEKNWYKCLGKQDEGELSEKISEKNEINHEK